MIQLSTAIVWATLLECFFPLAPMYYTIRRKVIITMGSFPLRMYFVYKFSRTFRSCRPKPGKLTTSQNFHIKTSSFSPQLHAVMSMVPIERREYEEGFLPAVQVDRWELEPIGYQLNNTYSLYTCIHVYSNSNMFV